MPRFRCPSCRTMLDLDNTLSAEEIFKCPGCQKSCRLPRSFKSPPPGDNGTEAEEDVLDVVAADTEKHPSATRTRQRDETDEEDALDVVEPLDADDGPRSRRGDSRVRRRDHEDYDDRRLRRRDDYDEDDRRRSRREDYDDYDDRRSRRRDDYDEGYDRGRSRRRDDYDDDYEDRRRRRRDDYDDYEEPEEKQAGKLSIVEKMERVHLGLGFHYAKILCILLALATAVFLWIIWPLIWVYLGLVTIAPILGLVGSLICCYIPRKSKARPLILSSFIIDAVASMLSIVGFILAFTEPGSLKLVLDIISWLCTLAAFVLFMLFLSKLASYLRDKTQSEEATNILFKWIILMALALIPGTLIVLGGRSVIVGWIGIAFGISWLITYIGLLLRLFQLLGSLRYRIGVLF